MSWSNGNQRSATFNEYKESIDIEKEENVTSRKLAGDHRGEQGRAENWSLSDCIVIRLTLLQGVTGVLFGLAITAFCTRSYIRICINKKVYVEDFILVLSVVSLCASTGLGYASLKAEYEMIQLVLHGFGDDLAFKVLGEIPTISKEMNAMTNIWWLVIFSVKMAFLFFFRRLISRLRTLEIWWWFATTLTVIAGLVSVSVSWLTCPYFTIEGLLCEQRPFNRRDWIVN